MTRPLVVTPGSVIEPLAALATSIHASPGVYALLAGSGVSSSAGAMTGWEIVCDLIRRVALGEGVTDDDMDGDPAVWWARQGRPELGYDTLLEALAPTDTARHMLLRSYFDQPAGPDETIPVAEGHQALARLVATGRIRVIVTTNFDPLIERALHAAGVSPQVIYHPDQVAGMIPLNHAAATVIKLHGDYANLPLRNTREELATYPRAWTKLLDEIFDRYGLIVAGWSATWDVALRLRLTSSPNRRFPTYWATHNGVVSDAARLVIDQRQANEIPVADAGGLLVDLAQRMERLDQVVRRRGRPRFVENSFYSPNQGSAPDGWAVLPLVQVRVGAYLAAPHAAETGFLRGAHRAEFTAALDAADVTAHLRAFTNFPPASAVEPGEPTLPWGWEIGDLGNWELTPGVRQTHKEASYRLGGDGHAGISALAAFRPPSFNGGHDRLFLFDAGISVTVPIPLRNTALLIRDAMVLVTAELPATLVDVLPPNSQITRAEAHIVASTLLGSRDGTGTPNRDNDITRRVDLSALGSQGPPPQHSIERGGFQVEIDGLLTLTEASELTAAGIEYIALAYGWPDPDAGISTLRSDLGLSPI